MRRNVPILPVLALLMAFSASPVAATGASVDRVEDFETVLAVAAPANFPVGSLMRADCAFVSRVERPDGSALETMRCTLSDSPVMVPAFQGSAPDRAFHFGGGACTWTSDYWWNVSGTPVYADAFSYVVTPSGAVHVTASYPAVPLSC